LDVSCPRFSHSGLKTRRIEPVRGSKPFSRFMFSDLKERKRCRLPPGHSLRSGSNGHTVPSQTDRTPAAARTPTNSRGNLILVNPNLLPTRAESSTDVSNVPLGVPIPATPAVTAGSRPAPASAADAEHLQSQFQSQLDALASLGQAKFHFVDYAPPSFVLYRDQVVLQMTPRNMLHFAPDSGSIYKRAAQGFDLFLALQLKDP
jgi:hypothetical protein